MNKKGETGFFVGLAILSLILVVLGAKVAFVDNAKMSSEKTGKTLNSLLEKELTFKNIENYLYFSLRFSTLSALGDTLNANGIWERDRKSEVKDELKNKIKSDFLARLDKLKKSEIFKNVKYPEEFTLDIVEKDEKFAVILISADELVIKDNVFNGVNLHDNLRFEQEIDFDLGMLSELYKKYSMLETDEECNSVGENELFGENKVKCTPSDDFLSFEVETKDLGLVKPVIKFRISKPGEIEFMSLNKPLDYEPNTKDSLVTVHGFLDYNEDDEVIGIVFSRFLAEDGLYQFFARDVDAFKDEFKSYLKN